MKKSYIFIALAMVAALSMASCKNTKTAEPTPEEIQSQKLALADSVLTEIDELAEQLFDELSKYDEEMEMLRQKIDNPIYNTTDNWADIYKSREAQIQHRITHKDKYIARRNALLQ